MRLPVEPGAGSGTKPTSSMFESPAWFVGTAALVLLICTSCYGAASPIPALPGTSQIGTGSQSPDGAVRIGSIEGVHGSGCGSRGRLGDFDNAFQALLNEAARVGADYVQILHSSEPREEGECYINTATIQGIAWGTVFTGKSETDGSQSSSLSVSSLPATDVLVSYCLSGSVLACMDAATQLQAEDHTLERCAVLGAACGLGEPSACDLLGDCRTDRVVPADPPELPESGGEGAQTQDEPAMTP